jgi:hypothetical protein
MVSAAAPGYRTRVEAILQFRVRDLDFVLDPAPFQDDPRYEFIDPTRDRGKKVWNCGNCHRNSFEEWKVSRHAVAARNAVTRAVYQKDFLPALERGDATGDPGLCSACHAPSAALDGKVVRLDAVTGVGLQGNHCDFCHKVHHTEDLEAAGVRGSLALGRPSPDDATVPGPIKRVYGSLADSDYLFMGPVYNPYFATSALCAGCHQYTTKSGIPALNTYAEWAAWASGQREAQSCQSCHMPTGSSMEGKKLARRIAVNALRRPNGEQIHDHSFYGRPLLSDALSMRARAANKGDLVEVETEVKADKVGHRVPTGSADRHLLLVVVATDDKGNPLKLAVGPRVPDHAGGEGDPLLLGADIFAVRTEAGDFASFPGREFAQVLVDKQGRTHVPFWRAVALKEDTRLEPGRTAKVRHTFRRHGEGPVKLRVMVVHRLRFKAHDVAHDVKGDGVRPLDLLVLDKEWTIK